MEMFPSGVIVPNAVQTIYGAVASGFCTGIYQLAVARLLKPVQQHRDFSLHQVAGDVQACAVFLMTTKVVYV